MKEMVDMYDGTVAGLRIGNDVCIFRQIGNNVVYIYGMLVHLN